MLEQQVIELKKHVGIIHCANNLSLVQRKLSNALLYYAYNDLLTKEVHSIAISELAKLIGYRSHAVEGIKKAIRELMSTVLEWNLLEAKECVEQNINNERREDRHCSWHASSILASARISRGICSYSYSHELKQLLYRPEIYGKINLLIQSKFTSTYALALYENCIRYQNVNHTGWISFIIFRKLMGVSEDKYQEFKDFKKRVLDKALEEVNTLSDIFITVELKRIKQQIEAIRFIICKNNSFKKKISVDNLSKQRDADREGRNQVDKEKNLELQQILKEKFNLSYKQIDSLLDKYDVEFIFKKIKLIQDSDSFIKHKINNIAAYFLAAVNEDFQPIKKNVSSTRSNLDDYCKEQALQKRDEETKRINSKAYNDYIFAAIEEGKRKLKDEEKFLLENLFRKAVYSQNLKSIIAAYNMNGYNEPGPVRALFIDFILTKYPNMVQVVPFEEFIRQQNFV